MSNNDIADLLGLLAVGIIISLVHVGWFAATLYGALWIEWNFGPPDTSSNDGILGALSFIVLGACLLPIPISVWSWMSKDDRMP